MNTLNKKIEDIYPLTPMQEGMLFHALYEKENTAYIIQSSFKIKRFIDHEKMSDALNLLALSNSALRTFFVYEKVKAPCQVVLTERRPELKYTDLSDIKSEEKEQAINKLKLEDIKRGFNLVNDTLIRANIIKMSDDNSYLIFTMHHIIIDGWCLNILLKKVFEFYDRLLNGEKYDDIKAEIAKERSGCLVYVDFIKWQTAQDKNKALEYWKRPGSIWQGRVKAYSSPSQSSRTRINGEQHP